VSAASEHKATVAAAAAAAAEAAATRGASTQRRTAIATVAAEAAAAAPAVAAVTATIVAAAETAGVKVTGLTNYQSVLKGAALKTRSMKEAATLRRILKHHPSVKHVHDAVSNGCGCPAEAAVTDVGKGAGCCQCGRGGAASEWYAAWQRCLRAPPSSEAHARFGKQQSWLLWPE
jgi:hypothetical protein